MWKGLQMQDFYNILLMDPGIPLGSYRSCFALLLTAGGARRDRGRMTRNRGPDGGGEGRKT